MRHVLRVIVETGKVFLLVLRTDGIKDVGIQIRKIESELESSQPGESQGSDLKVLGE
jgi:hypothetical protein